MGNTLQLIAVFLVLIYLFGQIISLSATSTTAYDEYVISIINTRNVPTPAPFDQLLNITVNEVNPSVWSTALSYKFLNMLFMQNGQKLYAWIQNYTQNYVLVWVKIPTGIPAESITQITLIFTSSVQYPYTGIAPELTIPYGEYDNGHNVFLFYNNFKSPLSLADFKVYNGTNPQLATVSFNDGFNLTAYATSTTNYYLLSSTVSFNEPIIAFAYISVNLFDATSNPIDVRTYYPMLTDNLTLPRSYYQNCIETPWADSVAVSINGDGIPPWAFFSTNDSGIPYQYNTYIQGSFTALWGVGYGYSTPVSYFYENSFNPAYTIDYSPRAYQSMRLVLGFAGAPTGSFSIKTYYVFVAPLPPNGVMPVFTVQPMTTTIQPAITTTVINQLPELFYFLVLAMLVVIAVLVFIIIKRRR
ncbi:hypothetical protein [Saccharolobus shibatae]|nr:hypothetical protein [Saccharolobus shibatae]